MSPLLHVENLSVHLRRGRSEAALLDGVGFSIDPGQTLGVVGESGCGKSILALALIGLLPPTARASGSIWLERTDLTTLPERELCARRGRQLAMIFQEPMLALNPMQPIGRQVAEGMRLHLRLGRAESDARARLLLDRVGLPASRVPADAYPHALSGGQRQRVLIAMALACDPALLIADEFSTALDMTTQAQILALLAELAAERRMALLMISHDLGLVSQVAERILVLYAGRAVEVGPTATVFHARTHPYTQGLLAASLHGTSIPTGQVLPNIPGQVPEPFARPEGCGFAPRCRFVQADCRQARPPLVATGQAGHHAACLHPPVQP